MARAKKVEAGTRTVQSSVFHLTKKYKMDELSREVSEELAVHTFQSPQAYVGIKKGITVNMGNWESVRLDASISIPCYPEEVGSAYKFAEQFVEKRLEKEVNQVKGIESVHPEINDLDDDEIEQPVVKEKKKTKRGRPKTVKSDNGVIVEPVIVEPNTDTDKFF